jgi:zinc transport system substrate-binding protein
MNTRRLSLALLALCLVVGCGDQDTTDVPETGGKPVVMTTFYPTLYFVRRIAGDLVDVRCPVPEDEDAIFWQPDEATIGRYQKADLIVVNGAEFEKWVAKTSLPTARVVDTAKLFEKDFVRFEHATTHSHGPAGEHAHEGIDGHTWVDPVNAKAQAAEIHRALVKLLPGKKAALDAGLAALTKDLDDLAAGFASLTGKPPLLASHPAYNYLAKRYGWNLANLDLDPETMPEDEIFASMKEKMEAHPAKYLLWESTPKPEIAARFRDELGITSITFSPCELMSQADLMTGKNYLTVMKANLEALKPAFE